jgi:hypothetical protein
VERAPGSGRSCVDADTAGAASLVVAVRSPPSDGGAIGAHAATTGATGASGIWVPADATAGLAGVAGASATVSWARIAATASATGSMTRVATHDARSRGDSAANCLRSAAASSNVSAWSIAAR